MKKFFTLFLLFLSFYAVAQQNVHGHVSDEKGFPLAGASVRVGNSKVVTQTDSLGNFKLVTKEGAIVLSFTMVGYLAKNVSADGIKAVEVVLYPKSSELNQIIVTGVFDKRKRLDASVAISTISSEQIKAQAPVSAVDLLKDVPGVMVNSSTGEIQNVVVVRGTPVANNVNNGYIYVSLQEDGLPVTNLTGNYFGPDYYLRADAATGRVEAVRGGSASITGSDAPGGLFNYVSKRGGLTQSSEVRVKYGLEGDWNPYYRVDFNTGGPLDKKGDWTYDIGGFYRYSDGPRYSDYPLNKGGQIRGNIIREYNGGQLRLYVKYLNDHNGSMDLLPFVNFNHPTIAPGFKNTYSLLGSANQAFDYRYAEDQPMMHFDPKQLIHNIDRAIGLQWQQNLGKGWRIDNNIKYSDKQSDWNTINPLGFMSADSLLTYYILGALGQFGNYTWTDLTSNKTALVVNQGYGANGLTFTTLQNNMPNKQIMSAPVLFQVANGLQTRMHELMENFMINKQIGKTTLTAGAYVGVSGISFLTGYAGTGYSTLENHPHPLGLTYAGSQTLQYSNPEGFQVVGAQFQKSNLTNNRVDIFFGQSTPITPKLTLDYGFRHLYNQYIGSAVGSVADSTMSANGGYDGNPNTLYDNRAYKTSAPWSYNKSLGSWNYSVALNYKFNDHMAIYGRFSHGKKQPDLSVITNAVTATQVQQLSLIPLVMTQAEIGYKAQFEGVTTFITPFFSRISNLVNQQYTQDVNPGVYYYTPPVYSVQQMFGVEMEGNIIFDNHWTLRVVGTIQDPKSPVARAWDVRNPGPQDDTVIVTKNGGVALTPCVMAGATPTYKIKKFSTFVSWHYIGKRAANALRAFYLPGYSQFDFGANYQFDKHFSANVNVNNLFNGTGVNNWYAPGGFPANMSYDSFTKQQRGAAGNSAVWGARTIQPRCYYLTINYTF